MDVFLISLVKSIILILLLLTGFAYLTYYERKLLSRLQVRYGPNRAGPLGLLQPIADAVKAIFKEEIVPGHVEKVVYIIAPALSLAPALLAFAVVPIGPGLTLFGRTVPLHIADVNVGVLYVLAVASLGTYGVVLAGWSSNNKYAMLGTLRTAAQMISYELPMGLLLASILLVAGTLSLVQIVEAARPWYVWLWTWLAFPLYFICMLAETNRSPFDLPETENELVAGYQTEYGGIKFALFMMSEYLAMITASGVMVTLFFGGWRGPLVDQYPLLGMIYFVVKVIAVLFLFIWVRASVPRVRYDQLMRFCWKVMLPLALLYLAGTAVLVVALRL